MKSGFNRKSLRRLARKIAPGIRLKLTIMTALFVTAIIIAITYLSYLNQSRIQQEGFERELALPLRQIAAAVTETENAARTLILAEKMKLRIKEREEELKKYRKFSIQKSESFGNRLRSIGSAFGMRVRYAYTRVARETYYSRYLSTTEITAMEKSARSFFRTTDMKPIDDARFALIQKRAATVARLETARDAAATDLSTAEKILKESDDKSRAEAQRTVAREQARLKKIQGALTRSRESMMQLLRPYCAYAFMMLDESGLSRNEIRIRSHTTDGVLNYDTGAASSESTRAFTPLLEHAEFTNAVSRFFEDPALNHRTTDWRYTLADMHYSVSILPIYRNPDTYSRAALAAREFTENGSAWKQFIEQDTALCSEMKKTADGIRSRIETLRSSSIPPFRDAEFNRLHQQYSVLQKRRALAFKNTNPYADESKVIERNFRNSIANLEKKLEADGGELRKLLETGKDETEESEIIKLRMTETRTRIEDLTAARIKASQNLSLSRKLTASDAIAHLRDAALFDFIRIKDRSDSSSYSRYLSDPDARKREQSAWMSARRWIAEGKSENSMEGHNAIGSGILAYSRTEAENYMFELDTTPLAELSGMFGIQIPDDGLIRSLERENLSGYNIVMIDRTPGIRRIEADRNRLIIYAGAAGILAIILAYIFAHFVVRRINSLITRVQTAATGDLEVTFLEKGLDEVEDLAVSLNLMMSGLRERAEMKSEIAAAAEIQNLLLPQRIPETLGGDYTIGTFYRPMKGVGGDYYDFIDGGDGKMIFCIGDVSNHGVGPALVMAMTRSHLHGIIANGERDLVKILLSLNGRLHRETPGTIFVTFFIGIMDMSTDSIEYISAGHLQPLIYKYRSETIEILDGGGLPLGMDDNDFFSQTISAKRCKMSRGDIFFQYTDGLTEAMNAAREMYGTDRLCDVIKELGRKKSDILASQIARSCEAFTGKRIVDIHESELDDDIAMIAVKRIR